MLKLFLLLSFVFWWILNTWKRRHLIKLSNQLPSKLTYIPFLGHSWKFIGTNEDRMNTFQEIGNYTNDVGGLSSFWNRDKLIIIVTEPKTIDFILKNPVCLEKGELIDVLREFTGNGIVFAKVPIWRSRRKVVAPCFTTKSLMNFANIFCEQSIIMTNMLRSKADSGPFTIQGFLNNYATEVVHLANLGVNIKTQLQSKHPFPEALAYVSMHISKRICQPWLNNPILKFFPQSKKAQKLKNYMYDYIGEIIKNKKESIKMNSRSDCKTINDEAKTFLEILMDASSGGYSDTELIEDILAISLAGIDTTTVGSGFTLMMMAKNPEIQEKVHQEIKKVLGDINRPMESDDISKLTYLNAVIKESLRLYPPVPVIMRTTSEEIKLPSGHTIYPGCDFLINIYSVHRNPKYWGHDAEIFRPERFLEGPSKHPAQYIPFSNGIRNCIGFQYATMAIKTSVANIIQKFRVVLPTKSLDGLTVTEETPIRIRFDIVMKDVEDFLIRLETRK